MNIYLHPLWRGTLAQLVEQWTENPCVPGSIPGGTTKTLVNLMIIKGFLISYKNSISKFFFARSAEIKIIYL